MRRNGIRSAVGVYGMMIYTPDQTQVCIASEVDGESYNLRNEPAFFWSGKEELFHLQYRDEYTGKETAWVILRWLVGMVIAICVPKLLQVHNILSIRQSVGLQLFFFSMLYMLEFAIFKGIKRGKSKKGRKLLKFRGALNKAMNAFEKNGKATLEDAKRQSIYRRDMDYHMEPQEITGILFVFVAISFLMPTLTIQFISIPILVVLAVMAFKSSFFGVLEITFTAQPDEYELKMACDLVQFWKEISYSDSLQAR